MRSMKIVFNRLGTPLSKKPFQRKRLGLNIPTAVVPNRKVTVTQNFSPRVFATHSYYIFMAGTDPEFYLGRGASRIEGHASWLSGERSEPRKFLGTRGVQ